MLDGCFFVHKCHLKILISCKCVGRFLGCLHFLCKCVYICLMGVVFHKCHLKLLISCKCVGSFLGCLHFSSKCLYICLMDVFLFVQKQNVILRFWFHAHVLEVSYVACISHVSVCIYAWWVFFFHECHLKILISCKCAGSFLGCVHFSCSDLIYAWCFFFINNILSFWLHANVLEVS